MEDLTNTTNQRDVTDIHKTLDPTPVYTFFSSSPGTFFRIHHMLGHKFSIDLKRQIAYGVSSQEDEIINNRSKTGKPRNLWELNNILLNNP